MRVEHVRELLDEVHCGATRGEASGHAQRRQEAWDENVEAVTVLSQELEGPSRRVGCQSLQLLQPRLQEVENTCKYNMMV